MIRCVALLLLCAAVPAWGQDNLQTLVRKTGLHFGLVTVDSSIKLQINRILGGETGAGRLQRNTDWQVWRSRS